MRARMYTCVRRVVDVGQPGRNMAERQSMVQQLADDFMGGWYRSEEECASGEALRQAEKAMVNRNVELLCWYRILKGLREMAGTGRRSWQQEASLVNWNTVLSGILIHEFSTCTRKTTFYSYNL